MAERGSEPHHRTRRRRVTGAAGAPAPASVPPSAQTPSAETPPAADDRPQRRRSGGSRAPAERTLRDLVGNTPSQVGVEGALRARDVNRPTAEDLAAAERNVVIVRRNWRPDVGG
jgi:hypothetical protein